MVTVGPTEENKTLFKWNFIRSVEHDPPFTAQNTDPSKMQHFNKEMSVRKLDTCRDCTDSEISSTRGNAMLWKVGDRLRKTTQQNTCFFLLPFIYLFIYFDLHSFVCFFLCLFLFISFVNILFTFHMMPLSCSQQQACQHMHMCNCCLRSGVMKKGEEKQNKNLNK